MEALVEKALYCPYCGELIELLVDCSVGEQEYIEDCQICCRPITLKVSIDLEGLPEIAAYHENE